MQFIKRKSGELSNDENTIKLDEVKTFNKWIYLILFIVILITLYTSLIINLLPNLNNWVKFLIYYGGRVIVVIIPFFQILKRDFKEFLKNKKIYMGEIVKFFSITMLFYLPVSLILNFIIGSNSTNQNLIEEIPLWITAILGVIIAPISEEILFRGFLRRIFKNDYLFVTLSGIIFGIIHCMYIEENWLMYLFVLPYAIMGVGFAKLYAKTNNIFTNIIIHFIWNSVAFLAMLILSI